MGKDALTEEKGKSNRLTASRGKLVPEVYVQGGYKAWFLEFKSWLFRHQVAKYLFVSGVVPSEFTLEPTRSGDGELSLRWTVTWTGSLSDYSKKLTSIAQDLRERVIQGGDLTPDEAVSEKAFKQAQKNVESARRIGQNNTYLPSLGMTAGEALKKLSPGAYIAAPGAGILRFLPVALNEKFPTDTRWLRKFVLGGYFVWIGKLCDSLTLEMTPVSNNPQFQKDISWYLRMGDSLSQAETKFTKQWDKISLRVLSTFVILLTIAPRIGGRADLAESAFATASRDAERMIGREVRPEKEFGSFVSHISPIESVQAIAAAAIVGQQGHQIYQEWKEKHDAELEAVSDSVIADIQSHIVGLPQKQFENDLRTGQLGEAIVKKTLELRGYSVVELQNASGHGIDLVAIKTKGASQGLIVYLEVKSSAENYPGRLSVAQTEAHEFVRSRLERVIAHEGFYKNVNPHMVEIAKMLVNEIDTGRPIGGIRADVHWLSKGVSFKVKFNQWNPSLPRASVITEESHLSKPRR
jgi:Holliday junction resolvase-like predicted endonuclease